eukprot:751094-Hanusia_phi.AAC.1
MPRVATVLAECECQCTECPEPGRTGPDGTTVCDGRTPGGPALRARARALPGRGRAAAHCGWLGPGGRAAQHTPCPASLARTRRAAQ